MDILTTPVKLKHIFINTPHSQSTVSEFTQHESPLVHSASRRRLLTRIMPTLEYVDDDPPPPVATDATEAKEDGADEEEQNVEAYQKTTEDEDNQQDVNKNQSGVPVDDEAIKGNDDAAEVLDADDDASEIEDNVWDEDAADDDDDAAAADDAADDDAADDDAMEDDAGDDDDDAADDDAEEDMVDDEDGNDSDDKPIGRDDDRDQANDRDQDQATDAADDDAEEDMVDDEDGHDSDDKPIDHRDQANDRDQATDAEEDQATDAEEQMADEEIASDDEIASDEIAIDDDDAINHQSNRNHPNYRKGLPKDDSDEKYADRGAPASFPAVATNPQSKKNRPKYRKGLPKDDGDEKYAARGAPASFPAVARTSTFSATTRKEIDPHSEDEDDEADVHNPQLADEPEEDLTNATLLEYSVEKGLVKFMDPSPRVFLNARGTLWGKVRHVDWKDLNEKRINLNKSKAITIYPGIQKLVAHFDAQKATKMTHYRTVAKKVVVCPLCFDMPSKSLANCAIVIGVGKKETKKPTSNTSNISQHFKKHHPEVVYKDYKWCELVTQDPTTYVSDSGQRYTAEGIPTTHRTHSNPNPKQSLIKRYSTSAGASSLKSNNVPNYLPRAAAIAAVRKAVYVCANDLGFPNNCVEKKIFREMLQTVRRNAPSLNDSDLALSNKAILSMRVDVFNEQVFDFSELFRRVRNHYKKLCGKEVPHVTICHDIWNGKKKEILGLSVMFIDPRNCHCYKIPIAFVNAKGHDSADICELTWTIMSTYGFQQSDLIASVNDNTNGAVLASAYITGHAKGGKCDMHKCDLILKHATGLVKRYDGHGGISDHNPEFMYVYNLFLKFARWLMDKKSLKRFRLLKEWCKINGKGCIEIPLPNITRVSGSLITIQALQRMKFVMQEYSARITPCKYVKAFKKNFPSEADWKVVAEFEAILNPIQKCSMSLQQDEPSASSASMVEIFHCQRSIELMREPLLTSEEEKENSERIQGGLLVLSMDATVYPDTNDIWDGKKTIHSLSRLRRAIPYEELDMRSQFLMDRCLIEFNNYFNEEHSPHQELALVANPLLAYLAPLVLVNLGVYKFSDYERLKNMFLDEMVSKCFNDTTTDSAPEINESDSDSSDGDGDALMSPARKRRNDDFALFEKKMKLQKRAMLGYTGGHGDPKAYFRESCKKELEQYMETSERECNDMALLITNHPTTRFNVESTHWSVDERKAFRSYCRRKNYLQVAKYFDVLKWWSDNQNIFPRVFVVSLIWLGVPPSNAFQERQFSKATYYSSNKLMNRQSSKSFEMRTLNSACREILIGVHDREFKLEKAEEDRRRASGELDDDDVIESEAPNREQTMAAQTVQLLNLTKQLVEFNKKAKPTIEGPTISRRFLKPDGSYGTMTTIKEFQEESDPFDSDEDNDDDLMEALATCVATDAVATDPEVVTIDIGSKRRTSQKEDNEDDDDDDESVVVVDIAATRQSAREARKAMLAEKLSSAGKRSTPLSSKPTSVKDSGSKSIARSANKSIARSVAMSSANKSVSSANKSVASAASGKSVASAASGKSVASAASGINSVASATKTNLHDTFNQRWRTSSLESDKIARAMSGAQMRPTGPPAISRVDRSDSAHEHLPTLSKMPARPPDIPIKKKRTAKPKAAAKPKTSAKAAAKSKPKSKPKPTAKKAPPKSAAKQRNEKAVADKKRMMEMAGSSTDEEGDDGDSAKAGKKGTPRRTPKRKAATPLSKTPTPKRTKK